MKKLLSIQVGMPKFIEDNSGLKSKEWETALFKEGVEGLRSVKKLGIAGDGQADLENHGGLEKAINVYPNEHYHYWQSELGIDCKAGGFGENLTTEGMLESEVCIGDIYKVGSAIVQVSQPRQPCWKIARRWGIKKLALFVQQTGKTGWYFRVIKEGCIEAPDTFELMERPHPEWSIEKTNQVMYVHKKDWGLAKQLSQCDALAESWKVTLSVRAKTKKCHSELPRLTGEDALKQTDV